MLKSRGGISLFFSVLRQKFPVVQADPELLTFLPRRPKCWDSGNVPPPGLRGLLPTRHTLPGSLWSETHKGILSTLESVF